MYTLLKKVLIILSDIECIFSSRNPHPRPHKLFRDYLRLRIKASFNRWFHFTEARFLSYTVRFPDYEIFFVEFRQIFIRHAYYMHSTLRTPHIIDCGGNIGMSVLYFKYLYPEARITVFEPSREVIDSLKDNLARNNVSDVTIVTKAVNGEDGTATMHSRGAAACGNTLDADIAEHGKTAGDAYEVPTTRLTPYIDDRVDILKLDIEGSEGAVIRELEDNNKLADIRTVTMEYHYGSPSTENNLGTICTRLEKAGFIVEPFSEDAHTTYSVSMRAYRK